MELLACTRVSTYTKIELQENAKLFHAWAFPIPCIHEDILKKEVEQLIKLGVLKRLNYSQWAAPTFVIPKKNGTVRFISDFRELNKRLSKDLIQSKKSKIYYLNWKALNMPHLWI